MEIFMWIKLICNNRSPYCGIGRKNYSSYYLFIFDPITVAKLSERYQSKALFSHVIKNLHW